MTTAPYTYPPKVGSLANPVKAKRPQWVRASELEVLDLIDDGVYIAQVVGIDQFNLNTDVTKVPWPCYRIMTTVQGIARFPHEFVKRWVEAP